MENVLRADGVAIAWAVSEELIGLGAYTLFATHFTALSELAELYPNAKLWHFTVDSNAEVMVTFKSRIKHGRWVPYVPADTIQMPEACLTCCSHVTDGTVPLGRRRCRSALCSAAGACEALFESSQLLQGLHYGHKLLPGSYQSGHYGLLLAPVVHCFPHPFSSLCCSSACVLSKILSCQ